MVGSHPILGVVDDGVGSYREIGDGTGEGWGVKRTKEDPDETYPSLTCVYRGGKGSLRPGFGQGRV